MLAVLLAVAQGSTEKPPLYPHLAAEINEMTKVDQEVRMKLIAQSTSGKNVTPEFVSEMRAIDHKDTARMKWIVAKFGWPTPEMVGDEACGNAWLLVQHADDDHPFQKLCLALIEPLSRSKIIEGRFYAYLYDRVQVGDHKIQRFGTQGKVENGLAWIQPVVNPKQVDVDRKTYGLDPLETYVKQLADMYKAKPAPDWRARLTAATKR